MQYVCCYEFSLASLDPCITIHWGLEEKTAVEVCWNLLFVNVFQWETDCRREVGVKRYISKDEGLTCALCNHKLWIPLTNIWVKTITLTESYAIQTTVAGPTFVFFLPQCFIIGGWTTMTCMRCNSLIIANYSYILPNWYNDNELVRTVSFHIS